MSKERARVHFVRGLVTGVSREPQREEQDALLRFEHHVKRCDHCKEALSFSGQELRRESPLKRSLSEDVTCQHLRRRDDRTRHASWSQNQVVQHLRSTSIEPAYIKEPEHRYEGGREVSRAMRQEQRDSQSPLATRRLQHNVEMREQHIYVCITRTTLLRDASAIKRC